MALARNLAPRWKHANIAMVKEKFGNRKEQFLEIFPAPKFVKFVWVPERCRKKLCEKCKGKGVLRREEEISIDIPAGIRDGEMVRMTGYG